MPNANQLSPVKPLRTLPVTGPRALMLVAPGWEKMCGGCGSPQLVGTDGRNLRCMRCGL